MDRMISLLAALVGLIALGGAVLVHVNAETQRTELAAQIAQLRQSVAAETPRSPATTISAGFAPVVHAPSAEPSSSASEPSAAASASSAPASSSAAASAASVEPGSSEPIAAPATDVTAQLQAMQQRIAELEQTNKDQASQLAEAQARLGAQSSSVGDASSAGSSSSAPQSSSEAVVAPAADGPVKDCIPLGTRFMGAAGDSFAICKTHLVLKVAAVADGLASIKGAGDVLVGGVGKLDQNCSVSVFSADTSGFAEMRVSCN